MGISTTSQTNTMRGVLLLGFGGFEKLEYREDLPIPVPQAGEVLIQVGACGINNTDVWTREGAYGNSMDDQAQSGWQGGAFQFPRIQGADIVGRMVAVGAGVTESRLHERTIVNPTLYAGEPETGLYNANIIGSERDGGFAEFVTVPAANAIAIDSPLSDAELATFMISYLTAEHMLNRGQVSAGERVLITGASGGVGSALVQLAKRRGTQVIAVVGRGKEERVKAVGADFTIERDQAVQAGLGRCGFETVDAVMDVVGGSQAATLLDVLRPGGRFTTAGAIAGPRTEIDWRKVYLKHLSILGSTMGTMAEAQALVHYITAAEIKPLLAKVFPFSEIVQAQQFFLAKNFLGKLVLVP